MDETPVSNLAIPPVLNGLALAINQTYTYSNNSYFGALIPNYYRDYYFRNIKVACGWLDGFVYTLHNQTGIISTRIGNKLVTGLARQIVGEKPVFKKASKEQGYETLRFINKWADEQNIAKAIYAGIGYSMAIGTSLLKVNKRMNGELWLEAVRFDNCFYLANYSNEVQEATFFIKSYTDTRKDKSNQQFILVEHRFYKYEEVGKIQATENGYEVKTPKGSRKAMVEYLVYQSQGTSYNNLMQANTGSPVDWQQLPADIRRMIKNDYSAWKIGEPIELGFTSLGVEALLNGHMDLSVPTGTSFGEGLLIGVQDDLITYEVASSYLIRDMYLGKGTVYTPKDLNISDFNQVPGVLNGLGDSKIEMIKGVSPDQQKIVVEQFNLRASEWQTIKENCLRNIAVKWGMSPKVLASFLATPSATATAIDSEDDMAIAFIHHTRSYFKPALNKIIELVLNYFGYQNDVEIDFASPSLINKDRLLDRTLKQLENGLIDIDEALHVLNPDMDEEALEAKIEQAKKNREAMMLASQNEFNDEGGFGNNLEDLGGANLQGSTSPLQ